MSEDPYAITIPANKKWDITASLLKYERCLRKNGFEEKATDLTILCDNIEHQIQEQAKNRESSLHNTQD